MPTNDEHDLLGHERLSQGDLCGMLPHEISAHVDRIIADRDRWKDRAEQLQAELDAVTSL
jgi:hypothetical protein